MDKKPAFTLNSYKKKLFESILKPLLEENLTNEHHYQMSNMTEFLRRYTSLESLYAKAYAQAVAIENKLKNSDFSMTSDSGTSHTFPTN